jgi:hypothetical protein
VVRKRAGISLQCARNHAAAAAGNKNGGKARRIHRGKRSSSALNSASRTVSGVREYRETLLRA